MSVTGMPVKAMLVTFIVRKIPNPNFQIPNKFQIPIAADAHSLWIVLRNNCRKNQRQFPRLAGEVIAATRRSWIGLNQTQKQPTLLCFLPANLGPQKKILFA